MKSAINKLLRLVGLRVTSYSNFECLLAEQQNSFDFDLARAIGSDVLIDFIQNLPFSRSQLRQDLFALSQTGFKRGGYFVEFGATDGRTLSNTFLLEEKFGWLGILAEPGLKWHDELRSNRKAELDFSCVWQESGQRLMFNEVEQGEFSTIDTYSDKDLHAWHRRKGNKYQVDTISLEDLLKKHSAPNLIDYLSIDTEGSEFEIIENFDFNRYTFRVITCEHNFSENREKVFALLTRNGYERVLTEFSKWDDWYVKAVQ